MPEVKDRPALTKRDLERRYELAPSGLEDGTDDTPAKTEQSQELRKSGLVHRRNERRSRRHTSENSPADTDLACVELQPLQKQIKNIPQRRTFGSSEKPISME